MKAKEAISHIHQEPDAQVHSVPADMPVIDVLPLLLDSPRHEVGVEEDGRLLGIIDGASLLESLGRLISARDDSSVITVECNAADYSASILAHAVEDNDVHLVDLLSHPAVDGKISIMLRIRCSDPTAVIHTLERHGYNVVEVSAGNTANSEIAAERLLGLQVLMNV